MRIECIGGGPASLYFAILMKQARPDVSIRVRERNRADDTFGWGVVFSEETLAHFRRADAPTYDAITARFARWDDIDTYTPDGSLVKSTGHGFCGLSRRAMLQIFHDRCRELGVDLVFEANVDDAAFEAAREADLVVAGDGVHSRIRFLGAETYRPSIDWGRCRFTWLGTTKPLDAFTFIFRETEHGPFAVHAYPFEPDRSTFIVECHEDTWKAAGLDEISEDETVERMEALFSDHLDGHRLLANRSIWRRFPEIRCERWHDDNVVLIGDAAHTAHFSIGSGTKLAMEDAIALAEAFRANSTAEVPTVLAAYQASRDIDCLKLQKAARTSQTWFEHVARYEHQSPLVFTFNMLTRSKRITYDNLGQRDPALVERVTAEFDREHAIPADAAGRWPPPLFAAYPVRSRTLSNRIVVSPMCQYSAVDGMPQDWHFVHLGSLAVGGAGLVMAEATAVLPEGRITPGCTGIYADDHIPAWRRITEFAHAHGPQVTLGLQLGHAGRKASVSRPWEGDAPLPADQAWPTIGPSAVPFAPSWPPPRAMTRQDMDVVRDAFVTGARRALLAGFDLVELHMAHGYLLSSFLSPVANHRDDEYGGSLENRLRFPLEVLDAVRAEVGDAVPVFARISATDWLPEGEGFDGDDAVQVAAALHAHGADVIDVSSGGNDPHARPAYGRMYQVPFAERIRLEAGVPVMAVGAIQGWDHANTILAAGRTDLVAMARPHLQDPHLTLGAAARYGRHDMPWPTPYLAVRPAPPEMDP